MKLTGPLSEAEKQIWGADAVRDPVTGVPTEMGSGSAHHATKLAATPPADYTPMIRSPFDPNAAPVPDAATQSTPAAPTVPRTIDPRHVHSWPERRQ